MYLCICNAITEDQLKEIIKENKFTDMDSLQDFGIADNCYKCYYETQEKLIEYMNERTKTDCKKS